MHTELVHTELMHTADNAIRSPKRNPATHTKTRTLGHRSKSIQIENVKNLCPKPRLLNLYFGSRSTTNSYANNTSHNTNNNEEDTRLATSFGPLSNSNIPQKHTIITILYQQQQQLYSILNTQYSIRHTKTCLKN